MFYAQDGKVKWFHLNVSDDDGYLVGGPSPQNVRTIECTQLSNDLAWERPHIRALAFQNRMWVSWQQSNQIGVISAPIADDGLVTDSWTWEFVKKEHDLLGLNCQDNINPGWTLVSVPQKFLDS